MQKELTKQEIDSILAILKPRFENNRNRHKDLNWNTIEEKLLANIDKLWSINQMEITGGAPDVVGIDTKTNEYLFYDCAPESPNRRSFCYDKAALDARKENKPKNSAMEFAKSMNVEILTETEYKYLQTLGKFDTKTSSWVKTPDEIRKLGGAIFCDFRYDTVFTYHNGAESYYAARGFRAVVKV